MIKYSDQKGLGDKMVYLVCTFKSQPIIQEIQADTWRRSVACWLIPRFMLRNICIGMWLPTVDMGSLYHLTRQMPTVMPTGLSDVDNSSMEVFLSDDPNLSNWYVRLTRTVIVSPHLSSSTYPLNTHYSIKYRFLCYSNVRGTKSFHFVRMASASISRKSNFIKQAWIRIWFLFTIIIKII